MKNGKIDSKKLYQDLNSNHAKTRKKARILLADKMGIRPTSLRLKKKSDIHDDRGIIIPLLDLFLRFHHEGKQNQLQTLYKLTSLNKDYQKAFQHFLNILRDQIKIVVSLCHFFDLTQTFPKNTFRAMVGVSFILDDPKMGWKSRIEYKIYMDETDKHFHLFCHEYFGNKKTSDRTFPNTKRGFLQLLDVFVPILKTKIIGLEPYWGYLRPLTEFDQTVLLRFNLIQKNPLKDPLNNTVFRTNPQTISHWDMSYLQTLSDDDY